MSFLLQSTFFNFMKHAATLIFLNQNPGSDQVNLVGIDSNCPSLSQVQTPFLRPFFQFDNLSLIGPRIGVEQVDGKILQAHSKGSETSWNKNIQASFKMTGNGKYAGGVKLLDGPVNNMMIGVAPAFPLMNMTDRQLDDGSFFLYTYYGTMYYQSKTEVEFINHEISTNQTIRWFLDKSVGSLAF